MEQTESTTTTKNNLKSAVAVGKKGLDATGRFLTKVLDFADKIDRWFQLHGGKLIWFIWLSLGVVVIAPIIDWLRNDWRDTLTFWTTAILFVFILIISVAWIGSLRDDEGNWSFKRVWSRLITYLQINYDYIVDSFSKPKEDMFYRFSIIFIVGSFCFKALQNVSVFFRKALYAEQAFGRLSYLRTFEKTTNTWAVWIFIMGALLLIYFCYSNERIKEIFFKSYLPFLLSKTDIKTDTTPILLKTSELVINAKNNEQVNSILQRKNSELFNEFILALQKWNPRECYSEDDFENKLHRHLKRSISNSSVQRQYRIIVDPEDGRKDNKADIVVNDTILIEMKKDNVSASSKYVFDQVYKYSGLWGDKGPVVLLFCEANYDKVKAEFVPRLTLLEKDNKRVVAFVAKPV